MRDRWGLTEGPQVAMPLGAVLVLKETVSCFTGDAEELICVLGLEVLLAEVGGAGLLVVLESSITVVLIATSCHHGHQETGGYSEY